MLPMAGPAAVACGPHIGLNHPKKYQEAAPHGKVVGSVSSTKLDNSHITAQPPK